MEVLRTLSPVAAAGRSALKVKSLSMEASRSNDQENTPPLSPNLKLSTTSSPRKATTPSRLSKSPQKSQSTQSQVASRGLPVSDTDASVKVIFTSFSLFFFNLLHVCFVLNFILQNFNFILLVWFCFKKISRGRYTFPIIRKKIVVI